jgi:hypothetical protein
MKRNFIVFQPTNITEILKFPIINRLAKIMAQIGFQTPGSRNLNPNYQNRERGGSRKQCARGWNFNLFPLGEIRY